MSEQPKTRKPTAAERLAARAWGQAEPQVIELPTQTSADLHYAALLERQRAAARRRSAGSAAEQHAAGYTSRDDGPPPAA